MPEVSNDEILEFLVQKVEETGVSPSVTLTIGGLVVVGGLVRSKLYYDYLSSLFDTYTDKPEGGTREHGVIYDTKDPIELETLEKYSKDWKEFMIKLRDNKYKDNGRPTQMSESISQVRTILRAGYFSLKRNIPFYVLETASLFPIVRNPSFNFSLSISNRATTPTNFLLLLSSTTGTSTISF